MGWHRFPQMASWRAFIEDVVGSFTLAESCCSQLAFHGADGRGWRFESRTVIMLSRLCAGLYGLNGFPRLLNRLGGCGCYSCAGL